MTKTEGIKVKIKKILKEYFSLHPREFILEKMKVQLRTPSYGCAEDNEVIESLLTTSVTMGKKAREFE